MTVESTKPAARHQAPDEALGSDPELAELWRNPVFRAAIEAARADPAGEVTLEEFEREHPLTEEQKATANAWLDVYERQLSREGEAGDEAAVPPPANGAPGRPRKPARAKKR